MWSKDVSEEGGREQMMDLSLLGPLNRLTIFGSCYVRGLVFVRPAGSNTRPQAQVLQGFPSSAEGSG